MTAQTFQIFLPRISSVFGPSVSIFLQKRTLELPLDQIFAPERNVVAKIVAADVIANRTALRIVLDTAISFDRLKYLNSEYIII